MKDSQGNPLPYRIRAATHGFEIDKRHWNKEQEEEYWTPFKYPGSLVGACALLHDILMRDELDCPDIKELEETCAKHVKTVKAIGKEFQEHVQALHDEARGHGPRVAKSAPGSNPKSLPDNDGEDSDIGDLL